MIQKMKKLTFLVYHKEYNSFLKQLQKLGVMHIQKSQDQTMAEGGANLAQEEKVAGLQKQIADVNRTISQLSALVANVPEGGNPDGAAAYVIKSDEIAEALRVNAINTERCKNDVESLEPWGNFDRAQIERLAEVGIKINYYIAPAKNFAAVYPEYIDGVVSSDKNLVYFVSFNPIDEDEDIAAQSVTLPTISLAEAQSQLSKYDTEHQSLIASQLEIANNNLKDIVAYRNELENTLTFEQAQLDTTHAADDMVMVLEGWYPVKQEATITNFLNSSNVYYESREPLDTDNVPIKFDNDSYSRMFERLTKMYGFPSYNEWDPTPIVAPFFTLFFAICMGDAGYGIVIALYGLLGMMGKTKNVPIIGEMLEGCESMICVLGIATTVVGFMLGTFFGINIVEAGWIPQTTALGSVLAWLQGNVPGTGYSIQMAGAICIGVFHICLAMVIKALLYTKKEGFKSQISTWGWVLLLVGGVITGVLSMAGALSAELTQIVLIAIGAVSALGIYFLNNIDRFVKKPVAAIIVNPLAGLYDTYNMASGLMGDILSYIRLYALCLAGGMLGGAFNMIGDMVRGDETSWTIVFAILIYVVGHVFNLLMSAISAFVHPLRLNFVEYFKNAGYEGKGEGYKPFEIK